jgi:hypothetical protein
MRPAPKGVFAMSLISSPVRRKTTRRHALKRSHLGLESLEERAVPALIGSQLPILFNSSALDAANSLAGSSSALKESSKQVCVPTIPTSSPMISAAVATLAPSFMASPEEKGTGKVLLCHHPALGNGLHFIISVSAHAVPAHLAQGDMLVIPDDQPITDVAHEIHASECVKQPPPRGVNDLNPDAIFIRSEYNQRLNRDASDQEVNAWLQVTHGPLGRTGVVLGIEHSFEALDSVVKNWYQTFLGRAAAGSEERHWVDLLSRGAPQVDVLSQIFASGEFAGRSGATDDQFIQTLFNQLLNRSAGQTEVAFWKATLPGKGRASVAAGIQQSIEFRTNAVAAYYNELLGRAPDEVGLHAFVCSGMALELVRVNIEASQESFQGAIVPPGFIQSISASAGSNASGPVGSTGNTGDEKKVEMCHHPELGNDLHFIITVSVNSVPAHLAQGDKLIIPDSQPVTDPNTQIHASDCQKQEPPRGIGNGGNGNAGNGNGGNGNSGNGNSGNGNSGGNGP